MTDTHLGTGNPSLRAGLEFRLKVIYTDTMTKPQRCVRRESASSQKARTEPWETTAMKGGRREEDKLAEKNEKK